jgi:hypothetical protein
MEEGKKPKAARMIVNLAAKNVPPEEIAAMVEEDLDLVREVLSSTDALLLMSCCGSQA